MYKFSVCIETLFTDDDRPLVDRIQAVAEAGQSAVEMWGHRNKPIDELAKALKANQVALTSFISEPRGVLADPSTHRQFLSGVRESCKVAEKLGTRNLVILPGNAVHDTDPPRQLSQVAKALRQAASIAAAFGTDLLLEPLNSRIDHPGRLIDTTKSALKVIQQVDAPNVKLLLDYYHMIVMGEGMSLLEGAQHLIGHVQVADFPGRHEPGTGAIDWGNFISTLETFRYSGLVGLEYYPSTNSKASTEAVARLFASSAVPQTMTRESLSRDH
jgi:hydroxypyruvate isomerase